MRVMRPKKAALVTGAARRIGKALALRLAREGFVLALHASERSRGDAEAVAEAIRRDGGEAAVFCADLADAGAVAGLIPAAAAIGPLTLLVNNASLFEPDGARDFAAARFDAHMAVNLRAPCLLAQAFAAQAGAAGGLVVNVVDQRVWRLNPRYFSYTLSKSALWSATQTLAQSLAPQVRVNAIGPGPTLANERQENASFERETANVLLRRSVGLEDIADALMYFVGAPTVTGQMLAVDSGQHLAWETPDVLASEG